MNQLILNLVVSVIRLFEFLLFARAIFSWFPQAQGSRVAEFLYFATEPLITPFRKLFANMQALSGFPLDLSFLAAYITLEIVLTLQNRKL